MHFKNWPSWCLFFTWTVLKVAEGADDDYNLINRDGSFQFGYETPDSYHHADANRNNVVRGEFGGRNPGTGAIDSTIYTAGPRGFRPRGKNVHRKYDLNQSGPRPIGSRDDPYYDPFEDPSYNFGFRTRTYTRQENANRAGDVTGKYSYLDDVGERHNVEFIAGKNTGFHVKTPFPDSNPRAYGPLYFRGRGKPIPRGRTSIQRGLDGSYRFVSAGPDQRRTETSDSTGHVRGSYTYLDDKGVQHSVHYIAGPETGYKVLKNVKGPHLPTVFPFGRPGIIPPDFYDFVPDTGDVFDTAASGHVKPPINNEGASKPESDIPTFDGGIDVDQDDLNQLDNDLGKPGSGRPGSSGGKPSGGGSGAGLNKPIGGGGGAGGGGGGNKPSYDEDSYGTSDDFGDDLFGGVSSTTSRPSRPPISGGGVSDSGSYKPSDDGSYKPSPPPSDGSYIPPGDVNQDDGQYRPGPDESGLVASERPRPGLGTGISGSPPRPTRPLKPSYQDDYDYSNDLGLFGSETNSRPPLNGRPRPPVIQVQGDANEGCENCRGTIVTNVGDRLFTVPPGVSVRAHVQSIDLLPLVSKVPSPSEQFKQDMNIKTEQLNSEASDVIHKNETVTESDITTSATTTTTETTTTVTAESTKSFTTTTIATTPATTTENEEEDESIF